MPLAIGPNTTLWYLCRTFNLGLAYTAAEAGIYEDGGGRKLGFLRHEHDSFGRLTIYADLPRAIRQLFYELQNLFPPLYPIKVGKPYVSEQEAATLRLEVVPRDVYLDKGYTSRELMLAIAEWKRTHPNAQPVLRAKTPEPDPPPIDYGPVKTHANIYEIHLNPLLSSPHMWAADYDDEAEDQLPRFQQEFVNTHPRDQHWRVGHKLRCSADIPPSP